MDIPQCIVYLGLKPFNSCYVVVASSHNHLLKALHVYH